MKKTALAIIIGLISIYGQAQTMYDAYLFSENNYDGTARSVAMGNAFTALGGDLGSIGLNPAGSAVAGYSQITLTPAITFSASTTKGVSPVSGGTLPYFERQMKTRISKFNMPNLGVVLNFKAQRMSGLKNVTLGFVMNQTASWDEDVYANGTNSSTSFMGCLAENATYNGFTATELNAENAYDNLPWKSVVGYLSGMYSPYGGFDDQFVGASEIAYENGEIALGGPLNQSYGRKVKGAKYDYVINLGANFSDFIYVGANLGITSIDYSYNDYFKETAIDQSDFKLTFEDGEVSETTYFNDMKYKYSYYASGVGYYGKFGVIVTPGNGLRVGAAISTPTVNWINEEWRESGETTYANSKYDASASSPYGEGEYKVVSPFRANFGLAYTIGALGVVSADYEICDYSQMKFKSDYYDRDYFEETNADIKEYYKASHIMRVGAEIKPIEGFAVRAGYGLMTSPEVTQNAKTGLRMQNVSLGVGYNSKKSFFADLAAKGTFMADEYFMPYDDYVFDANGDVNKNAYAPEILNRRSNWKVLLTLGWRF